MGTGTVRSENRTISRKAGCSKPLVSLGLGLVFGALAGVVLGLVLGVGISMILGLI